jgi:hypothetical protein
VMDSLRNRGLIRVLGGDGGPERVVITSEGMAAIGVEADDAEASAAADTAPTSAEADSAADAPAPATPAKSKPARGKGKARASRAAPATSERTPKPTPRAGTKQALMIDLLKRPEGATVEQIAEATSGWQHHTIRGAISGAQEEARAHGRGHPHPRGRPEQDRRQGQRHHLPDRRVARPTTCQNLRRRGLAPGGDLFPRLRLRHRSTSRERPGAAPAVDERASHPQWPARLSRMIV